MPPHLPRESELTWIKATKSVGLGACVELALSPDGKILLRDSKYTTAQLQFTFEEFDAFVTGAKNGEFDHLLLSMLLIGPDRPHRLTRPNALNLRVVTNAGRRAAARVVDTVRRVSSRWRSDQFTTTM